jgi:hypothetical protein
MYSKACVFTLRKLTTKKREVAINRLEMLKEDKLRKVKLRTKRLKVQLNRKEIMSKDHLPKMLEMFLVLRQPLKLEFRPNQKNTPMIVTMKVQLPEVVVKALAEVEVEVAEEEAEEKLKSDMVTEILKLQDLMEKETHTLMTLDQEEEEILEEVESMVDSINKMVPEELEEELEEKEMMELLTLMMTQITHQLKKSKKFQSQWLKLNTKSLDNLMKISLKLDKPLDRKKLERLKESQMLKFKLTRIKQQNHQQLTKKLMQPMQLLQPKKLA